MTRQNVLLKQENPHAGVYLSLEELVKLRSAAAKIELYNQKKARNQMLGGHLSNLRGRGIDFDEARNYQPGDDIRHMHWRVTARTGTPHIKLYHEERERPVLVFVDLSASMFFGTRVAFKSYIAVQAAALLGWAAADNGDRIGGVLCGPDKHLELRPRGRKTGILHLLKALQDLNQIPSQVEQENQFAKAMSRLQYVAKPGSLIFILSDFQHIDKTFEQHLNRLSKTSEVMLCPVNDPLEIEPPPPNRYSVTNGRNVITIDSSADSFCDAYREQFTKQRDELKRISTRHRIPLLQLMTNQSIIESLYVGLHQFSRKRF